MNAEKALSGHLHAFKSERGRHDREQPDHDARVQERLVRSSSRVESCSTGCKLAEWERFFTMHAVDPAVLSQIVGTYFRPRRGTPQTKTSQNCRFSTRPVQPFMASGTG
jgi:hypothetical protein